MFRKHIFALASGLLLLALAIVPALPAAAATGSIYLSPSSKSAVSGASVTLSVRLSSSDAVNAVQSNLSYPTDKLDYLSTSFSGTAFEIQAQSTGGGGSVMIARGTTGSVSGDKLIATVTFRAKVSSGSAVVSVTGDSSLANNGTEIPSSKGSATITFSKPAPAPTPTPAPPADTTAPTITATSATASLTSATISWQTNEASDSSVDYGPTSSYGLTVSKSERVTQHQVVLSSSFLQPLTTYHFRVHSTDASGNKQDGADQTFTTQGVAVTITVKSTQGSAITGAKVTVNGTDYTTDSKGMATVKLPLGKTTVAASKDGKYTTASIDVGSGDLTDKAKQVTLQLDVQVKRNWLPYSIAMGTFVAGLALGYLIRRRCSPVQHIKRHGSVHRSHKNAKVSEIERRYGDKDPAKNPYISPRSLIAVVTYIPRKVKKFLGTD